MRAVAEKKYQVEEGSTYLDEKFWLERPSGPRKSFDKAVLDRAGDAPEGAQLESMNHFAMEVFDNALITVHPECRHLHDCILSSLLSRLHNMVAAAAAKRHLIL